MVIGRLIQRLVDYVQVFNGDKYDLFDPATGEQGRPENLLLWEYNGTPLLDVTGANHSQVTFSIIKKLSASEIAALKATKLLFAGNIRVEAYYNHTTLFLSLKILGSLPG